MSRFLIPSVRCVTAALPPCDVPKASSVCMRKGLNCAPLLHLRLRFLFSSKTARVTTRCQPSFQRLGFNITRESETPLPLIQPRRTELLKHMYLAPGAVPHFCSWNCKHFSFGCLPPMEVWACEFSLCLALRSTTGNGTAAARLAASGG